MDRRKEWFRPLIVMLAVCLCVSSCERDDERQRSAFKSFLRTVILDQKGLQVPALTPNERQAFGSYARQYDIIVNFNKSVDQQVSSRVTAVISGSSIASFKDMVARKDELINAKRSVNIIHGILDKNLTNTNAAFAELRQPTDVKPVYDAVYERLVSRPAAAYNNMLEPLNAFFSQAIELDNYIMKHDDTVHVFTTTIISHNPQVQADIAARLDRLRSKARSIKLAQSQLEALSSPMK